MTRSTDVRQCVLPLMRQLRACFMLMLLCVTMQGFAMPRTTPSKMPVTAPLNWVFSGMVSNEAGQRYGYYFEVTRQAKGVHVVSTLVNVDKKTLVFMDESDAVVPDLMGMNWQIGHAYIGFNTVTNRWILGVQTPNQQGFHFKIDPVVPGAQPAEPLLKTGLAQSVIQTGRINGHVKVAKAADDEFVAAKHTWFRQVLTPTAATMPHPLTNVLCQFNDGSGFYATHLLARDALQSFLAGWRSASGDSVKMSQFVQIHRKQPQWEVSSSLPAFRLQFSDVLGTTPHEKALSVGVVEGKMAGFCTAARAQV